MKKLLVVALLFVSIAVNAAENRAPVSDSVIQPNTPNYKLDEPMPAADAVCTRLETRLRCVFQLGGGKIQTVDFLGLPGSSDELSDLKTALRQAEDRIADLTFQNADLIRSNQIIRVALDAKINQVYKLKKEYGSLDKSYRKLNASFQDTKKSSVEMMDKAMAQSEKAWKQLRQEMQKKLGM